MSVVSAPGKVSDNKLPKEIVAAQSEFGHRLRTNRKLTTKGKAFMIEARSKNRETAYKNLKKKLVQIKESPRTRTST